MNTNLNRNTLGALVVAATLTLGGGLVDANPGAAQSAAGSEAWGSDNCLYVWNGSGWGLGPVCRVFPSNATQHVWDQYASNDAQRKLLFRVDVRTPGWVHLYDYVSKATLAVPNRGSWMRLFEGGWGSVYILGSDNQWYSAAAVMAASQQSQATQAAASNQCISGPGTFCIGGGPSPNRVVPEGRTAEQQAAIDAQIAAMQMRILDSKQRMTDVWLRSCVTSSNGC